MRIAVLDDRVQSPQVLAVGAGDVRNLERIQNRLVVLVDEYRDALAGALVQRLDQVTEALRRRVMVRTDAGTPFDVRPTAPSSSCAVGPAP